MKTFENIFMARILLFVGGLLFFLILELLWPYRPATVPKAGRWITNLTLAVFNGIVLNLIFASAIIKTATYATANRAGFLNMIALPDWVKILATVIFMDFMLYVWHFLNHEMPLFWRFHRVHHSDMNMDVSTGTRFHMGELLISAVIRIALIFFSGASVLGVVLFESCATLTTQFQHSSLKAPEWFERIFWLLFVPPSMHRIHHSVIIKERDTNYGTIFSFWDRALGTFLKNVDQGEIVIGMGAYRNPDELGTFRLLRMPFTEPVK